MLGLRSLAEKEVDPNCLQIHVRFGGKTVQVDLDPGWSVAQVKQHIGPKLGVEPAEIKIIFAGNELPDSFILQTCDVGQHSYLHAVRVQVDPGSSARSKGEDEGTTEIPHTQRFVEPTVGDGEEEGQKKESDFFVFCSDPDCNDLREGKLRVRCGSCGSGAFVVERPPENWEDALIPKRIGGVCDRGCGDTYAQFYFKCTSHVTRGEDDASPALRLVKRNREEVPCLACGDVKAVALVFPCPSAHVTCMDCFKDYLFSRLNRREFVEVEFH